jgi:hypothetical protein
MGLHLESVLLQHLLLWPAQQLHHQQHPHQLCQLRHYHPATHAARTLTQKLMQQHTWQASTYYGSLTALLHTSMLEAATQLPHAICQ